MGEKNESFETEFVDSVENVIPDGCVIDENYESAPPVRTVHIATDENGVITAIANVGKLVGGVDFTGILPDDFQVGKYMLHSETVEKAVEFEAVVNREEIDADPETEPVIETHTETVPETVYTIAENPDYVPPEPVPAPLSNAELLKIIENDHNAVFDGLKDVFDRNKPMTLAIPMTIIPNAFYRYPADGKLYVGVAKGIVTNENFRDMLEPDELPEEEV